jgi:hypothetical protein
LLTLRLVTHHQGRLNRLTRLVHGWTLKQSAAQLLTARHGRVSMATHDGISRQRLGRGFDDATGLSPKLFARIVRFQVLVHAPLSNDVAV